MEGSKWEVQHLRDQVKRLQEALTATEAQNVELESERDGLAGEVARLKAALDEALDRAEALQDSVDKQNKELQNLDEVPVPVLNCVLF
jgi:chromosome segregation ATPase